MFVYDKKNKKRNAAISIANWYFQNSIVDWENTDLLKYLKFEYLDDDENIIKNAEKKYSDGELMDLSQKTTIKRNLKTWEYLSFINALENKYYHFFTYENETFEYFGFETHEYNKFLSAKEKAKKAKILYE